MNAAAWAWFTAFLVMALLFLIVSHDAAFWRKRAYGYKAELTELMAKHAATHLRLMSLGIRVRCDAVSTDDLHQAAGPADITWPTSARVPGQRRPGDAS